MTQLFTRLFVFALLPVLTIVYVGLWKISDGVFYSFVTTETFEQQGEARLGSVGLELWISETRHYRRRSWIVPCIFRVKAGAPYHLQLRASDRRLQATRMTVHEARLVDASGVETALTLLSSHEPGSKWYSFFRNTNDWIVHLYHEGEFQLSGPFSVFVDVSIETDGRAQRESFELRMIPGVEIRSGIGFST